MHPKKRMKLRKKPKDFFFMYANDGKTFNFLLISL